MLKKKDKRATLEEKLKAQELDQKIYNYLEKDNEKGRKFITLKEEGNSITFNSFDEYLYHTKQKEYTIKELLNMDLIFYREVKGEYMRVDIY